MRIKNNKQGILQRSAVSPERLQNFGFAGTFVCQQPYANELSRSLYYLGFGQVTPVGILFAWSPDTRDATTFRRPRH